MPLVNKLYKEAQALPADKLPPLPKNSAIPEREPDVIEATMKVTAVTPAKLIRKDYNERDWRNYRWIYCRLTERVDAQIGQLLAALKKNGLEKNTLVIFTSDHGDMDGSHRLASKNVFYENSVGVPFIMQYKGVIPPAKWMERASFPTASTFSPRSVITPGFRSLIIYWADPFVP